MNEPFDDVPEKRGAPMLDIKVEPVVVVLAPPPSERTWPTRVKPQAIELWSTRSSSSSQLPTVQESPSSVSGGAPSTQPSVRSQVSSPLQNSESVHRAPLAEWDLLFALIKWRTFQ